MNDVFHVEGKSPFSDKAFSYLECTGSEANIGYCMFSVNDSNKSDILQTIQQYVRCGNGKVSPVY